LSTRRSGWGVDSLVLWSIGKFAFPWTILTKFTLLRALKATGLGFETFLFTIEKTLVLEWRTPGDGLRSQKYIQVNLKLFFIMWNIYTVYSITDGMLVLALDRITIYKHHR
jgi:hypothetical protein